MVNTFLSQANQDYRKQGEQVIQEQIVPMLKGKQTDLAALLNKLGQSGYLGITVPKEFGGGARSFLELVLFVERLAQVDVGLALSVANHYVVIELISEFADQENKSKYLPLLASGQRLATLAHSEGVEQIDRLHPSTHIVLTAGQMSVVGRKKLVVNGSISNLIMVLASQPVDQTGSVPSLWLMDVSKPSSFKIIDQRRYSGLGLLSLDEIDFGGVPISKNDRLSARDTNANGADDTVGFQFDWAMCVMRVMQAAAALGLLETTLQRTVEFTKGHDKFSKPLTQSQAVQWKIADMATESAAARLLTYRCAWSKEAQKEDFVKYSTMCKSYATKIARAQSSEAFQVFGQLIDSLEPSIEKLLLETKMLEVTNETNDESKVLLAEKLGI